MNLSLGLLSLAWITILLSLGPDSVMSGGFTSFFGSLWKGAPEKIPTSSTTSHVLPEALPNASPFTKKPPSGASTATRQGGTVLKPNRDGSLSTTNNNPAGPFSPKNPPKGQTFDTPGGTLKKEMLPGQPGGAKKTAEKNTGTALPSERPSAQATMSARNKANLGSWGRGTLRTKNTFSSLVAGNRPAAIFSISEVRGLLSNLRGHLPFGATLG
ncbi:MAG: hypothetical protein DHS80DRAFT_23306 [Piptocephalis tieghemiana]|nr:MAG: hypothetical protein DHS80DRAFT_23306 [Piptocephalis tieghemiana]